MDQSPVYLPRVMWSVLLAGVALVAAEAPSPPPVVPPQPLRYVWAQAGTLTYAVEIELDHGDEIETQKGTIILAVAPGQDGQAVVSMTPPQLSSQRALKPGRNPQVPGFGPPLPHLPAIGPPPIGPFNGHEARMDARGRILSERGDAQLPFALGAFIPLVFKPLPEAAEPRWQRTENSAIRITADSPFRSPFRGDTETGRYNAEAVTTCDVRSVTATCIELDWTYSLKTLQSIGGEAAMELRGSGTVVLDRARGLPSSVRHELRFHERAENREQRYPIRVTCTLLDEAELKRRQDQANAARTAAMAALEARRAPPTAAEREALLADLQSTDKDRARRAIATLQQKRPQAPDDVLAEALAHWLDAPDILVRQQAAEALGTWATAAVVPALLRCAAGDGHDARAAGRALASLKEKRAVPLLASKLTDMNWRFEASAALRAIGAPAEGPVAKQLKHADWGVRLEACRILQQIGTKDSLKGLDAVAAEDENPLVKQTAALAAQAVRGR